MNYQHKLSENERLVLLQAKNIFERLEHDLETDIANKLVQESFPFDKVERGEMETECRYLNEAKQMLAVLSTPQSGNISGKLHTAEPKVDPELVWLRWFYQHVGDCLGPADGDIYDSLKDEFDRKHNTVKVPASYRDEE